MVSPLGFFICSVVVQLLRLTNCSFEVLGFGLNLMQVQAVDKSQAACSLALLQKYFHSGDLLSGSVLCVSVTANSPEAVEHIMEALHQHSNYGWSILVTSPRDASKSKTSVQLMPEKPQLYFLVVEDLDDEDLEETLAYWRRMLNWNPLAQFVVYLASIEESDEEMTDLMVEILLTFMSNKLYNINVFGQSEENSFYYSKTVFPYHPDNNCGNRVITVSLLDACVYEDENEVTSDSDGNSEQYEEEEKPVLDKEADDDQSENAETENFDEDESMNRVDDYPMQAVTHLNSFNKTANATGVQPKVGITEFERALFRDKFPSEMSGCPIRAAFHGPWEPYIFSDEEAIETQPEVNYYEEDAPVNASELSYEENSEAEDYGVESEGKDDADGQLWSSEGLNKLVGIEYQLVQTIAQRLHMTIEFKRKSNNVFHLFNLLIEGRVEMLVGGMGEDPSMSQFVSSSTSYHQDDLTWCVARAKRKHSLFNFLASFDAIGWFLILLFILFSSLTLLIAQRTSYHGLTTKEKKDNFVYICLRMLGILLTQSISLNDRAFHLALRLQLLTAFLLAFFFSNSYQSFLISTLTTPTAEAQISGLDQIYSNHMTTMVTSENMRHLNKEGEIFRYIREKFEICYNIVDCLNYASDHEHLAVVVSRQHALYNAHIQRDKLFCFDRRESLYVYPVAMLLPKKFHLLHHINSVIYHVIESGHMQKWARDLDMVRMIQEKIARAQDDTFKALKLDALRGALICASLLQLVASYVFVTECLIYWLVVKWRTRLRLLKYLHRCLG